MNVMIIPEDFRKDQFILKPIVQAMMKVVGRPKAKVEVCLDPLLGGISRALDQEELTQIVRDRPMIDLFLLIVDRDREVGRRTRLDNLEASMVAQLGQGAAFLGENAWQEVEVWTIAGHDLLNGWTWQEIRADRDPKEAYFVPLAKAHGVHEEDDGGRKKLSIAAAKQYQRVRNRCREDIQVLHKRVEAFVNEQPVPDWHTTFARL